jgi:ATP-dependent Clp protease ATP-binding subunit ClpC
MPIPKFDTRAKNALAVAQQIALQLGHNYIGSEHLLFGILSQPQDGLPFQMAFIDTMSNNELLEIIRKIGLEKMHNSPKTEKNILPEITEELQNCLDNAISVAEKSNYSYVGVEHLIFGILETNSSSGKKLMNLNDESSGKLQDILKSIFETYGKTNKNDNRGFRKNTGKKDSALDFFTTNLNAKVDTEVDFNLVSRDLEIERIIQILSRKSKNNPILLGEPGVGKTALVEGLAKRINSGNVPSWLENKRILSLDVGTLLAGTVFRGEFEQRLKGILDEVVEDKNAILFIDEIHMAMGAGSGAQGGPEMAGMLKPALARGDISIIGATTEDEYRSIIKKDKAFERRFQAIRLEQPDLVQTVEILKGSKSLYENYHNCTFPENLLEKLVNLADRFVPERFFPDKAIDILDETLVRCRLQNNQENKTNLEVEKTWENVEKRILDLIKQKNEAILNENTELSEIFAIEQKELEMTLIDLNKKTQNAGKKIGTVDSDLLEKTVSQMSGVPLVRISSSIFTQIKTLEDSLNNKIFGQNEAITQISRALKRSYAGANPNKGPIASFLLLGPTGVGKTELVKVLTQELYGDPQKYLLKLDMSEFSEKHQISRLLGAPAGYVGYEDAPELVEFLRKKPYSVILFDEIEKGHPQNLNILLQMLEEGKITDAKGQSVSCQHALIFLTSNLGKNQLNKFASKLGFLDLEKKEEEDYETLKKQVMTEVEKAIKPEILGRLTSKIVFRPIGKTVLYQIINKELGILQEHFFKQGRSVNFEDVITKYVASKAEAKLEYGAREVKSLISEFVQDPIAEYLLDNPECMNFRVGVKNNLVVVTKANVKKTETKKAEKINKEK